MLRHIATFEFRYQLRNPVFWVTAGMLFLLTFGSMTVEGIELGGGGNVHDNAPFVTIQRHLFLSLFFMFVTTAFVANVIVRDDDTRYGPIIRSTRVRKSDYLFGRFLGAFGIAALAFLAVPFAIWLGSLMPWLDPENLGPNRLGDYLFAYLVFALPNILITSAIFFALATITRSMMATYLGVIAFLILYFVALMVGADRPDLTAVMAVAEPFGLTAMREAARYWTAAERNTLLPQLAGAILWNRVLWTAISLAALGVAYACYRFADRGMSRRQVRKLKREEAAAARQAPPPSLVGLPNTAHGARALRAQLGARTAFEMRQVFKSPAYFVLLALGLVNVVPGFFLQAELFGTPTLPVTNSFITILGQGFSFVPLVVAIYYAGELVWRERDRKVHEIVDATPLPDWIYVLPKTAALALVLLTTLLISVAAAVLVQLARGWTDLDLGSYLRFYIVPGSITMILLAVLAIFVQALSPSKYVGWGVMVLCMVVQIVSDSIGLQHVLYSYGETPETPLSDMNGGGHFQTGAWWLRLYWSAFAGLLLVTAHLLWRRGTETRLRPRLKRLPLRLKGSVGVLAATLATVFVGTGVWIFYNTNILNDYRTRDDAEIYAAEYEKRFLRHENVPQPTISHLQLNVALYPDELRARTEGAYVLTNANRVPVTHIHVRAADLDTELTGIALPGARLESEEAQYGYRIYRLNRPMMPGERLTLRFTTLREQRGFRNSGNDIKLVENGTFLNNLELAPAIGMNRMGLLNDRATRRKYDLPADLRPPRLEDAAGTARPYFGGGWSTADITISTSADQTPIAPGQRVSDEVANGRRTARFVSDAPIMTFFSIQSARYAVRQRQHGGVDLAVYYHPDHGWNVDRMLRAMQLSLSYYGAAFTPYQFDQARVVEFPGYRTFAQAFANTMPYSEAIGFAADTSDPNEIDYVTYITAHEVAHQWWAHQVIGASNQGSTVLSETLAQYSALMVMKRLYGEDSIRRFLKYELDRYLRGRVGEAVEEVPLARVENQPYIHYNKGSLVMYLLQERMGEAAVNRALRRLAERYRFRGAPYPRSTDLISLLREEARSAELQALITDLFERITIYDLKVEAPSATQRADGRWHVSVPVVARRFHANGAGEETQVPLVEAIEIGLFTAEPGRGTFNRSHVIAIERRPIRDGKQVLDFITRNRPTHVGVDPYNFYIDRNSNDNVARIN